MGGMVFGGKPDDAEDSQEESKKSSVLLRMGIFFDGTLNSIANIDERKDFERFKEEQKSPSKAIRKAIKKRNDLLKDNGSYTNEYSNVARFYKCYREKRDEFIIPVYVEGIGTKPREIGKKIDDQNFAKVPSEDNKNESYKKYDNGELSLDQFIIENKGFVSCSDDQLGSALGIGVFGVKKKVEAACERISNEIRNIIRDQKLEEDTDIELELYVFGFSRGSAAARCFSACLRDKVGLTKDDFSSKTFGLGAKNAVTFNFNEVIIKKKLKQENNYKTSLEENWLKKLSDENKIDFFPSPTVKFLGLYDTVSSYGANFDDDVDELGLNKLKRVKKVFQICAGDEYRANFNLTDISSAGDKGNYIVIPGAHSDIGGGYTHNIKEKKTGWFNLRSGNKPLRLLEKEGWFNFDESERTISNLYSIIPFLLMKDEIVALDVVFDNKRIKEYKLPSSTEGLEIDGIEHKYSKELCDFYDRIKSYHYAIEDTEKGRTINFLSVDGRDLSENEIKEFDALLKEEENLLTEVSDLKCQIRNLEMKLDTIRRQYMEIELYTFQTYIRMETEIREEITEREELLSRKKEQLLEIKKEECKYDNEQLLKIIRHDFLHLSVSRGEPLDLIVNKANNNRNKRTVYPG